MKRVLPDTQSPIFSSEIRVRDCHHLKYYGIHAVSGSDTNNKGFIIRMDYNNGIYRGMCAFEFTKGNNWGDARGTTLCKCIKYFVESAAPFEVYEFDTKEELCRWVAT